MGEHKAIKIIQLYETGGLLIKFKDESHTYIDPLQMKEILQAVIELYDTQFNIITKEWK